MFRILRYLIFTTYYLKSFTNVSHFFPFPHFLIIFTPIKYLLFYDDTSRFTPNTYIIQFFSNSRQPILSRWKHRVSGPWFRCFC